MRLLPKEKQVNLRITTAEAELDFAVKESIIGWRLFDQVARTIGLREVWYFGLMYQNTKGQDNWLNLKKKLSSIDIRKSTPLLFEFRAKFFPEDAKNEIIQDVTQRLFYLQVKEDILTGHLACPCETAVLLASYACQAQFGDMEDARPLLTSIPLDRLLPASILSNHDVDVDGWYKMIETWYREHRGQSPQEAMLSYLQLAQDLETFGVDYFEIRNRRGTDLLLGIDAIGLAVYKPPDKTAPKVGFAWSEISNITFNDRKFTIKPMEKKAPDFIFFTTHLKDNKRILALCVGNNELYIRRRQPESIEVKQMRAQAEEERSMKSMERERLKREIRARKHAEKRLQQLQARLSGQLDNNVGVRSPSTTSPPLSPSPSDGPDAVYSGFAADAVSTADQNHTATPHPYLLPASVKGERPTVSFASPLTSNEPTPTEAEGKGRSFFPDDGRDQQQQLVSSPVKKVQQQQPKLSSETDQQIVLPKELEETDAQPSELTPTGTDDDAADDTKGNRHAHQTVTQTIYFEPSCDKVLPEDEALEEKVVPTKVTTLLAVEQNSTASTTKEPVVVPSSIALPMPTVIIVSSNVERLHRSERQITLTGPNAGKVGQEATSSPTRRPTDLLYKKPDKQNSGGASFPHWKRAQRRRSSGNSPASISPSSSPLLVITTDEELENGQLNSPLERDEQSSESTSNSRQDRVDFMPATVPGLRSEESRQTVVSKDHVLRSKLLELRETLHSKRVHAEPDVDAATTATEEKNEGNSSEPTAAADKFDTLRAIRRGNTRKRIDEFEAM